MKKNLLFIILIFVSSAAFSNPGNNYGAPRPLLPWADDQNNVNFNSRPIVSEFPERIMSYGSMLREDLVSFFLSVNPAFSQSADFLREIIGLYMLEADYEGVNYEIAFAQMCYHTNFLKFAGTLASDTDNNFCGLTTLHNPNQLIRFRSVQEGIRAHIQHLKGYAAVVPLRGQVVNPRYEQIGRTHGFGVSPMIYGLSNRWAGPDYAIKISEILIALYTGEDTRHNNSGERRQALDEGISLDEIIELLENASDEEFFNFLMGASDGIFVPLIDLLPRTPFVPGEDFSY